MKAYKVVRKFTNKRRFVSAIMAEQDRLQLDGRKVRARLSYTLGKRTKAHPDSLGILCFGSLRSARHFWGRRKEQVILVGELEEPHRRRTIWDVTYYDSLGANLVSSQRYRTPSPGGTIAGTAFTPIAVVT